MSPMTRRQFLFQSAGCAGYLAAAKLAAPLQSGIAWAASSCTAQNKVLVHLFLDGGMDSANFLIPRNIQAYVDKRPNINLLSTSNSPTPPIVVNSAYALHPSLTHFATLLSQGKCAIVNKVGYPNSTRSHEDSKAIYSRAIRNPGANQTGWAGRFGDVYCANNPNVASVFSFRGQTKDISARSFVATTAGSLSGYGYSNDDVNDSRFRRQTIQANRTLDGISNDQQQLLNNSWERVDAAVTTIQTVATTPTNPDPTKPYGNSSLSQRFRDAARLIASGENPSIILLADGGYDTHDNELTALATRLSTVNQAIGAFWADIERIGRANDVTILIFTEFGRNTFENSTRGTDHGFGTVGIAIGNNINGGIFGPDYTEGDFASRPWLPGDVDFREILAQAVGQHLGVDPAPIFPEAFTKTGLTIYR